MSRGELDAMLRQMTAQTTYLLFAQGRQTVVIVTRSSLPMTEKIQPTHEAPTSTGLHDEDGSFGQSAYAVGEVRKALIAGLAHMIAVIYLLKNNG
jgi:hypothetical protein